MKWVFVTLTCLLFLAGCSPSDSRKEPLAKIDNYILYKDDFINEINNLPAFDRVGKTKEELLQDVVEKKIMLLEAQRQGLDKDRRFMKMVERFWEQSLLRVIVEKKMKEFTAAAKVDTERARRQEVNRRFEEWLNTIKKNTRISIDDKALEKITVPTEE